MELRTLRESAGLTQFALARLAKISRSSISHVENRRYPPSAAFGGKVCRDRQYEPLASVDVRAARAERLGAPRA